MVTAWITIERDLLRYESTGGFGWRRHHLTARGSCCTTITMGPSQCCGELRLDESFTKGGDGIPVVVCPPRNLGRASPEVPVYIVLLVG